MSGRLWYFSGGRAGEFAVTSVDPVVGETLPQVECLTVSQELPTDESVFTLRGVVSNERYVTRAEKSHLVAVQAALGRPPCTRGALIPIRKSPEWWLLTQEERRAIFEDRSSHIALGMRALPGVARRLHHCRDLGTDEPFDFLTWFDFSPEDESKFDDLLGALRATEEWSYVTREVEIRVTRER
jgi:chlorite dismutase